MPEDFIDFDAPGASSNDEGFSSEVPTSRRDENPGIVFSQVLSTMTEENENKEVDTKMDGGETHPKIWQLDHKSYQKEEDVEDPHYVLYEEQDTEDDLCSSGGHTPEILGNEISVEKLLQPIVRSFL